jgi:A/G-specific adenine glycosylase
VTTVTIELPQKVVNLLLEWHKKHRRKFPWRENRTPYRVLLAEILLQRTPAERVIRAYEELLKLYPDPASLARADVKDLQRQLKSLGLEKRVRWLIEAAREITELHGGEVPTSYDKLVKIAGVGDYTASAVLVFGYGKPVPMVDANIARVVSRVHGLKLEDRESIKDALTRIVPKDEVAAFYDALLDLAALVCKKKPLCDVCPISAVCVYASRRG